MKKIEKTDEYVDSCLQFSALAEEKVKQNVALEIYEDYFDEVDAATEVENFEAKTIISFSDPAKKRNNQTRPVRVSSLNIILSMRIVCFRSAASASVQVMGTGSPSLTAVNTSMKPSTGVSPPVASSSTSEIQQDTRTSSTLTAASPTCSSIPSITVKN